MPDKLTKSTSIDPMAVPTHLTIFHTNDMHGRLEAMARLSSFARRLRREAEAEGRHVYFWDAGDSTDPRMRLCRMSKGVAVSSIMNVMGYGLKTIGNVFPITYGPQAVAEMAAASHFPILAANLRDGDQPLPEGLSEYELFPLMDRYTMAVIGLTSPCGGLYQNLGMSLPDCCQVARQLVSELRSQGASLVIVLSHLGLEDDRRLAETVDGIDVIIGAHSHDLLPSGKIYNNVLITQAGEYAETLGRVDLHLDPDTGRLRSSTAQVLEVPADELPDPSVTAAIDDAEEGITAKLSQVIGTLASPLDLSRFRECGLGSLAADALREHTSAEMALLSSGLLHHNLRHADTVTLGQLEAACSTIVNPCVSKVRGEQLLQALERGLDHSIIASKHYLLEGNPMGVPQISGMQVTFDPKEPVGRRVKQVKIGVEPLEAQREYLLAHTNVEVAPEVGYLLLEESQRTFQEVPAVLLDVVESYVRRHSPLPHPSQGRWLQATQLAA